MRPNPLGRVEEEEEEEEEAKLSARMRPPGFEEGGQKALSNPMRPLGWRRNIYIYRVEGSAQMEVGVDVYLFI